MFRIVCLSIIVALPAHAGDWPQWLGPARDGVSDETNLQLRWPAAGPKVLWQTDVGPAFSGPVVAGDKLIIFHRVGNDEVVECRNAKTGAKVWSQKYPTSFEDGFNKGNGPRSTPVIQDGKIVTLGAEGELCCWSLADGAKVWMRELPRDYKIPANYFGVGTSPLIDDGRVLVNVGGKGAGIVAFDLADGKELWKATSDQASYSSPIIRTLGGVKSAVFFTREGVVLLDPKTGQVRHQQRWRARYDASVNAATPLVVGDLAFFSTSYETGALLLHVKKDKVDEVWSGDDIFSNHYNTGVYFKDHLYGFEGRQEAGPSLRCIELTTGKVKWTRPRFGCGSMILVDGKLLTMLETGELVLAEADPSGYRELARAKVLDGPSVRAQLALAHGLLYGRDRGKLICWDLRK